MVCGVLPVLNQITVCLWAYSIKIVLFFLPFVVAFWVLVVILYIRRRKNRRK